MGSRGRMGDGGGRGRLYFVIAVEACSWRVL